MIVIVDRGPEEGDDGIAFKLVDGASVALDDVAHLRKIAVDEINQLEHELDSIDKKGRQNYFEKAEKELISGEKSTFAIRVVKHGLHKKFLRVITLPIQVDPESKRIGDLEHFINRITRPPYGSR